jgi:predicted acylesterase/phospholipase RssA
MDFTKLLESGARAALHPAEPVARPRRALGPSDCEDRHEVRSIVRAGYAIPFLLPPVRFRGEEYADGGFAWNVPLDYALSLAPTEIYILAPIASELPFQRSFARSSTSPSASPTCSGARSATWATSTRRSRTACCTAFQITVNRAGRGVERLRSAHPLPTPHRGRAQRLMAAGYRDAKARPG